MSLPFGLLGLLEYSDNTGYDLAKMFEESINNFWHAPTSQIYRELKRMEEKGWVVSKSIMQEGKPNKKLYSITDEGRSAFIEWLRAPAPLFNTPHEPLSMYIMFGANAPDVTLTRLKTLRDGITLNLNTKVKTVEETIGKFKDTIVDSEKKAVYWQMVHELGLAQAKSMLQWAEDCIKKLEGEV